MRTKAALVLQVQPDFREEWDNRPDFKVLVGRVPEVEEYMHALDGKGHFRGQIDDCVHFIYSDGKPTHGFGGRNIPIDTTEGKKILPGGWSSNANTINHSWPLDPCISVSLTDEPKVMKDGYTFYSGAVTVSSILEWYLNNESKVDWSLQLVLQGGGLWIEPGKGRFVKYAHGLDVVFKLLPTKGSYGERERENSRRWFWQAWRRTWETLPRDENAGELSSEQMQAVRA